MNKYNQHSYIHVSRHAWTIKSTHLTDKSIKAHFFEFIYMYVYKIYSFSTSSSSYFTTATLPLIIIIIILSFFRFQLKKRCFLIDWSLIMIVGRDERHTNKHSIQGLKLNQDHTQTLLDLNNHLFYIPSYLDLNNDKWHKNNYKCHNVLRKFINQIAFCRFLLVLLLVCFSVIL